MEGECHGPVALRQVSYQPPLRSPSMVTASVGYCRCPFGQMWEASRENISRTTLSSSVEVPKVERRADSGDSQALPQGRRDVTDAAETSAHAACPHPATRVCGQSFNIAARTLGVGRPWPGMTCRNWRFRRRRQECSVARRRRYGAGDSPVRRRADRRLETSESPCAPSTKK